MVIQSSNIKMSSARAYSARTSVGKSTSYTQATTNQTGLSMEQSGTFGFSFGNTMKSLKEASLPSENYLSTGMTATEATIIRSRNDWRNQLRQQIMEYIEHIRETMLRRLSGSNFTSSSIDYTSSSSLNLSTDSSGAYTLWQRTDTMTYHYEEHESICYEAQGAVTTSEGKTFSIDVKLCMSRSFQEEINIYQTSPEVMLTDPLVFHLDGSPDAVSDEKFLFDIDSDGVADNIGKLTKGNAFLALDKNGDGVINDGSELFGTKSGNGFQDLSAYDEDKNGWIDENDAIYSQLRLWHKTDDGEDKLTTLKESDIGAIYLGYSPTRFSLNSLTDNVTKGVVRSTGMYLKEDGTAGTLQQVDLAVS